MDGGTLRHVTFRVDHDCPMARLSREVPDAHFTNWSGHRVEVTQVRCDPLRWDKVVAAAEKHLTVQRAFPSSDGGLLVAGMRVNDERSISRTLEAHQCIWLQPMRIQDGRESYDAIAYGSGPAPEQEALNAMSAHWPTQVVRRRTVGPEDLTASLFLSLRPLLDAPTDKQAEALLAAAASGYYQSPRGSTTAEVAATMGLGRSAFEERLRGGENRVLGALVPALEHHRRSEDDERHE